MTTQQSTRWISFSDNDNTTWLFDLTFLTSGWSCTFGTTCKGTEPDDNGARGCCAHGAYLIDSQEEDLVIDSANRLTPDQWQNHGLVEEPEDLFHRVDGEVSTTRFNDACIFLNAPGFDGGHGCALHIGALTVANDHSTGNQPCVGRFPSASKNTRTVLAPARSSCGPGDEVTGAKEETILAGGAPTSWHREHPKPLHGYTIKTN